MTRFSDLWECVRRFLRSDISTVLEKIYDDVDASIVLYEEDCLSQALGSSVPKWMRKFRNVLQYRRSMGEVESNGNADYRLTYAELVTLVWP